MGRKLVFAPISPEERRACNAIGARQGNTHAMAALREDPEFLNSLLEKYADLHQRIEEFWAQKVSGIDLLAREKITREIEGMRTEFARSNLSMLQRIVGDRIIASWLQANFADLVDGGADPTEKARYIEELRDRSSRRFLRACKTLAQIQKLLGPSIQVNIAEKQINVLNAGALSPECATGS